MEHGNEMVRLTGLWKGEAKDGSIYLEGKVSATSRLLILASKGRGGAGAPDYVAYLVPVKVKDEGDKQGNKAGGL
jgi:hypothetical protein